MTDEAVEHCRAFLEALGLSDEDDAELQRTPERVTELMQHLFEGVGEPGPQMSTFPNEEGIEDPVLLLDIPFHSTCVHHLVPFFGHVDVAYVPGDVVAGFGSFGRVVDHFARRPQIQERMLAQIADHLVDQLAPRGLLVRCRARQMCVELRDTGARGTFVSVESRGVLSSGELREEAMAQFLSAESSP